MFLRWKHWSVEGKGGLYGNNTNNLHCSCCYRTDPLSHLVTNFSLPSDVSKPSERKDGEHKRKLKLNSDSSLNVGSHI